LSAGLAVEGCLGVSKKQILLRSIRLLPKAQSHIHVRPVISEHARPRSAGRTL